MQLCLHEPWTHLSVPKQAGIVQRRISLLILCIHVLRSERECLWLSSKPVYLQQTHSASL